MCLETGRIRLYKKDGVACIDTIANLIAYVVRCMTWQRQHETFQLAQRKSLVVFPQLFEGAFEVRQRDVVALGEGLLNFGDALADADGNRAAVSVFEELTGGEMIRMGVLKETQRQVVSLHDYGVTYAKWHRKLTGLEHTSEAIVAGVKE